MRLVPRQRAQDQVLFVGEDTLSPGQDLNLLRAPIGIVFQEQTPFPMSIFENIEFGIHLYEKLPRLELESQVERSLRRAALRVSDLTAFMYLGGWRSPIRPARCSRRCATDARRTTSPVGVNGRFRGIRTFFEGEP